MQFKDLENRFKFYPPKNEETKLAHAAVKEHCLELARWINEKVPEGREQALAFTHLEEVMMWANAGIARNS